MKVLNLKALKAISGGEIIQYDFEPNPNQQVIACKQILIGYETVHWVEHNGRIQKEYEIKTPIYHLYPIYEPREDCPVK